MFTVRTRLVIAELANVHIGDFNRDPRPRDEDVIVTRLILRAVDRVQRFAVRIHRTRDCQRLVDFNLAAACQRHIVVRNQLNRVAALRRRDRRREGGIAGRADNGDGVLRLAVEERVAVRAELLGLKLNKFVHRAAYGLARDGRRTDERSIVVGQRRQLRCRRINRQAEPHRLRRVRHWLTVLGHRHVERGGLNRGSRTLHHLNDFRGLDGYDVKYIKDCRIVHALKCRIAGQLRNRFCDLIQDIGDASGRDLLDHHFRSRRRFHNLCDLLRFVCRCAVSTRRCHEERTCG